MSEKIVLGYPTGDTVVFCGGDAIKEILRLDKDGMVYKGERILDAGQCYAAFMNWLRTAGKFVSVGQQVLAWLGQWRDSITPSAVTALQDILAAAPEPATPRYGDETSETHYMLSTDSAKPATNAAAERYEASVDRPALAAAPSLPPEDTYYNTCISCGNSFSAIGKRHVTCPACAAAPSKLPLTHKGVDEASQDLGLPFDHPIREQALRAIELEAEVKFEREWKEQYYAQSIKQMDELVLLRGGLAADSIKDQQTILRLISTIKYITGIAERGESRPIHQDELPEKFVLGYVKRLEADNTRLRGGLAAARNAMVEFRDCILNQRGALAENGMDNDQVNDVLSEFDAALKAKP